MNKQALVFITLFSLILMLSIYYVTSPLKPNNEALVSQGMEGSIVSLQEKLNEKRAKLMSDNSSVLASANTSEQEKQVALEMIELLEANTRTEESIQSALLGLGFASSFIEIDGKQMKIIVSTDKENMEDAAKIISVALQQTNQQYAVEVSFRLK